MAGNRARKSTRRTVSYMESRSPGGVRTVKSAFCGVQRRPNGAELTLLFSVVMSVSD
jgi:hypothetical protein